MFGSENVRITPGMQRYIDRNNEYLAKRAEYIREVVKKWKFDTIAVHGLYSVEEAIEDYQGAIIEPDASSYTNTRRSGWAAMSVAFLGAPRSWAKTRSAAARSGSL